MSEIDSFIIQFKNLMLSGQNASLKIESKAGKAESTLHVEFGVPHPPAQLGHFHHSVSRDGPAQQRRQHRRAVACVAAAEQARDVYTNGIETVEETAAIITGETNSENLSASATSELLENYSKHPKTKDSSSGSFIDNNILVSNLHHTFVLVG